jgi:hypothetical protein
MTTAVNNWLAHGGPVIHGSYATRGDTTETDEIAMPTTMLSDRYGAPQLDGDLGASSCPTDTGNACGDMFANHDSEGEPP